VLGGELGVSQAFLALWYIGGGYMDVSEVVVFMIVAKYTSRTSIPGLSGGESLLRRATLAQYVQSNRRDLIESLEYAPIL